jgi:hypothetical protein
MPKTPEPHFREDRGYWQGLVGGRKVKVAEGSASKAEAIKAMYAMMAAEGQGPRADSIRLVDLTSKFLYWVERERDPATLQWYGRHLRSFCEMHGERPAIEIRPKDVSKWLAAHDWAEGTRSGAVTAVKRLYRWSKREGHIRDNPVADPPDRPDGRVQPADAGREPDRPGLPQHEGDRLDPAHDRPPLREAPYQAQSRPGGDGL